jgi:MarR family transcriptional regulator for hemolysin
MQTRKPESPVPPELTPSALINRSSRLLMRLGDARLRSLGLSVSQLFVLMTLRDGSELSQKELAQRARVEQPTMAEMLRRMQRDHLVKRARDPSDRRGSLISLSKPTLAKIPRALDLLMQGNDEALAGLSEREVQTLSELLTRVLANLERVASEQLG